MDYESTHPAFLDRLERSKMAVAAVGRWAEEIHGLEVSIPEVRMAPVRSVAQQFSDSGDIVINGRMYEVKGLTVPFTCASDWVFGQKFIVDDRTNYDKKEHAPAGYYIVDVSMSYAAFVSVKKTRGEWYVEKRYDSHKKHDQEFYFCPIHLVRFFPLNKEG